MLNNKYELVNKDTNQKISINIIITFIVVLFISLIISIGIFYKFWSWDKELVHTTLELLSVFMGVSTFLIIWNRHSSEESINYILGFGYLIVSIMDVVHTYFYKYMILQNVANSDASLKYWLIARIIEVITLLIFSYVPYKKNGNKYIAMLKTLVIIFFLFYILQINKGFIPSFYTINGITLLKIIIEYFVILVAALTLYRLKNNLVTKQLINFKFLYISILLIIPSEVCFTLFKSPDSIWVVYGHVLKICSYYYLYKAVFQSLINYPYDKINENNQRLSDILNAIPIPIHTYNLNNKIDFVNKKFEELFKYSKENIIGLGDEEISKILRKVGNNYENSLPYRVNNNEENTKNIIRTYLDSHNKEIKVLINAHKIKGGVLVITNDIKQEQQIENLNLQAQTILNSISVPTMIIDYNGDIIACNNYFADLVEVEYEDINKMNIYALNNILKLNNNEFRKIFCPINFKADKIDCIIVTPKGNEKNIQINTSIIKNIYNEIIGLMIVVQDVSKMKENQIKLINQEKLALLGQMGATIVHETRNFLTTIKGNSQLIQLYTDNERIKRFANKINSDTDEVNRIISDFLNLSKPRETELEEVAFYDLISSMKSTIETSSLMSKVQVSLKLDYDERYILCDETQIKQVILNICKNAVEALEQVSNPKLLISTGYNEQAKEVYIKIEDNGKGMSEDIIKKIGTPFFTTKKTGTGLGLNACYQIIKEHKGRIQIESKVGMGTIFTIIIPYLDED
ncbi:MASE3 domain-containing protein [Clostridium fungisolvens]|uniref:histidine kinase n=1 Tax=Clostridium fungisolvens TaxID=1604897 RepID=A0A6V8SGD8_9CLOT|nr:MASE3 domain-containing protein [Clostridium fungisolvens]GFP75786.1 Sensor histidine kinase RcsC [Clostridium fungisolvens]